MPVGTKENHKYPQSGYLVFKARFEPDTLPTFIFYFTSFIRDFTIKHQLVG
jgi:hypothetical protein